MKWPCGWINEVEMEMRGTMMMSVVMRLQTASMMLEVMELQ